MLFYWLIKKGVPVAACVAFFYHNNPTDPGLMASEAIVFMLTLFSQVLPCLDICPVVLYPFLPA